MAKSPRRKSSSSESTPKPRKRRTTAAEEAAPATPKRRTVKESLYEPEQEDLRSDALAAREEAMEAVEEREDDREEEREEPRGKGRGRGRAAAARGKGAEREDTHDNEEGDESDREETETRSRGSEASEEGDAGDEEGDEADHEVEHDADAADPAETMGRMENEAYRARPREVMPERESRGDGRDYRGDNRGENRGDGRGDNRGDFRGDTRGDNRGDNRGDYRSEESHRPVARIDAETNAKYEKIKTGTLYIKDLQAKDHNELVKMAEEEGVADVGAMKKADLILAILKAKIASTGMMFGEGCLEIMPDGFGFLRNPETNFAPSSDDIFVAPSQIRRFGLRNGHMVQGQLRPPKSDERFFALLRVELINGEDPEKIQTTPNFEEMTPHHPSKRLHLESDPKEISMRIVDLVTPIGKGQRMLIVAPPRTGKTVLMQKMANAISINHPEAILIILLVDERPEEVTDMRRNTKGLVISSTFDEVSSRHVAVTEQVLEMAKRYVEFGKDVVILMDSITRMGRAYNAEIKHSGRIMTGGLDVNALQRPKRFFGAARALEEGGSLTILGTALVDTNSAMDDVIFEEFKGTGNAELHLDRKLVDKRVYPAININASGTRREELMLDPKEMELIYRLRRVLADMNPVEAVEMLKSRLEKTPTNVQFLLTNAMG